MNRTSDRTFDRTFVSEDTRKDKLFEAWNAYFEKTAPLFSKWEFEESYFGQAIVSELTKNRIGFHLDDGRKIRHIPVDSQVTASSSPLDNVFVVLGQYQKRWWVLDLISIRSLVNVETGQHHLSYNPIYFEAWVNREPIFEDPALPSAYTTKLAH